MEAESETSEQHGAIFISDFVDVPLPLEIALGRFVRMEKRLADLASAAEDDGESLHLHIEHTCVGTSVNREVDLTAGLMRERGEARVVPLDWRSSRFAGVFLELSGDLELAPLGSHDCRLSLAASYHPPQGDLGRTLNLALFNRVAQSTVRSFLARTTETLETDSGNLARPVT